MQLDKEKRKAPAYRRQAQVKPTGRLFFNLLDGLTCDLEPMAPAAGQRKAAAVISPLRAQMKKVRA
ncbi:hypothetical protein QYG89_08120 [Bacillus sp. B190/17]|uniref:Transposase n=1 Tax=Bacillus lumedeiriae TaxID=3058829 RepID=A0ABW8I809_9BACI